MTVVILAVALVILLCVLAERFSDKFGMPALMLFMFIGMVFGSDGLFKIPFEDFKVAETVCSIALIFIMFYGGFNTKWKDKAIEELKISKHELIAMIIRNEEHIIPDGKTVILENDVVVMYRE